MGVYRICKMGGGGLKFYGMIWLATFPCGGLGVLPQENLEIWSALGAILGIF